MLDAQDLPDLARHRLDQAVYTSEQYARNAENYARWKSRVRKVDDIRFGLSQLRWPDMPEATEEMVIPNYIALALEDRIRAVAATRPTIRTDVQGMDAKEKLAAEKRERIARGYAYGSNLWHNLMAWGEDAGVTGLTVCKVMPDFSKPLAERFPVLCREDPRYVLPGPSYAQGPGLSDCLIATDISLADAIARWPEAEKELRGLLTDAERRAPGKAKGTVTVLEYYAADQFVVAVQPAGSNTPRSKGGVLGMLAEPNPLGKCPIVIGTRVPGEYRGEVDQLIPAMHTLNTMVTMSVDEGIRNIYAPTASFGVIEEEWGPDAHMEFNHPNGRIEFVRPPGQPYSNFQLMNTLTGNVRTGAAFSPSRSGDPNESVISAAGITAAQGQNNLMVASTQQNTIGPMLQAALELALEWDEKACDTRKTIYGEMAGGTYAETYTPSKDIKGNYRIRVEYGMAAGLDPINLSVMTQQQWAGGNGFISKETAMELSPLVEDPQRESRRIQKERLLDATLAGIVARASVPVEQGGVDPVQVAGMLKALAEPDSTLEDAVLDFLLPDQNAPLANPPGIQAQAAPNSPGIAGAGEAVEAGPPAELPPLDAILGGG